MTSPARCLAALVLALLVGRTSAAEKERYPVLVLKDGRSMSVRHWDQKGATTNVTALDGTVFVVKTESIDFERTKSATAAALRPPTPTPAAKHTPTLVEVARMEQERHRRMAGGDATPPPPVPGVPSPGKHPTPAIGTPPPPNMRATTSPAPGATTASGTSATPSPATSPSASPQPTQVAALLTPKPAAQDTPAPAPAPEPSGGIGGALLYGGIGVVLAAVAAGVFVMRQRGAKPKAAKTPAAAAAAAAKGVAASKDLLTPVFDAETSAEDLPLPAALVEDVPSAPAELTGSTPETRALTDGSSPAGMAESVLEDGREVQIKIGGDVYTCQDLETLKRWVAEGRVIENSEVLAPDGRWLLAGSIPDLEHAFESRRETLGY